MMTAPHMRKATPAPEAQRDPYSPPAQASDKARAPWLPKEDNDE